MHVLSYGYIKYLQPIDATIEKVLNKIFGDYFDTSKDPNNEEVEINCDFGIDLSELEFLKENAEQNGNSIISGKITYNGDCNGEYLLVDGEWEEYYPNTITNFSDEELITEVQRRGLIIDSVSVKKEEAVNFSDDEATKTITVIASPYANQSGEIEVPKNLNNDEDIMEYITDHWDDINFNEPDLDYCGTDFEIDY